MFDNMTRLFSRKKTDQDDIATDSSIVESIKSYENEQSQDIVEKDIDSVEIAAPAIDDMMYDMTTNSDFEAVAEPVSEEILSAGDTFARRSDEADNDDFESI